MPFSNFSKFSDAFRKRIQRSSSSKCPLNFLIDQSRSRAKLLSYVPSIAIKDLSGFVKPRSLVAFQSDFRSISPRKNFSFVGAISRAISVPSVISRSPLQVCGYNIDCLLPESSLAISSPHSKTAAIAACGSRISFAHCRLSKLAYRLTQSTGPSDCPTASSSHGNVDNHRNARMGSSKKDQPINVFTYRYFIYNVAKKRGISRSPYGEFGLQAFHSSYQVCSSAGPAPDMSFDKSFQDEQIPISTDASSEKIPEVSFVKLNSGSCYLPHPEKEETGGEDAHFICGDGRAIGVADGVGGWADLGINAGYYARELMSNSIAAIEEEPKGSIDPARVLEKAYAITKSRGSSTACIIALTDHGLQAINLGDSGFMVVRDGSTVFRSPVQQHDFNFTYQLESGNSGDLPRSGQVFTVKVAPGDVIIAGSDGLFDNLYTNDITEIVVHAVRAGLSPQITAQKIAALAQKRAQDKNRQTPFSTAAQNAGIRYHGGKLDDITVVVSYIINENKV